MRNAAALLCLLCALNVASIAMAQQEEPVDVELVLAVDVSRSMTSRELATQRRGYAAALVSEPVARAVRNGLYGQVALLYMEWAGSRSQRIILDWTLIRNREDLEAFSDKLGTHFNPSLRRTSIANAIDYAAGLFEGNGYRGIRQVIDISGDGPNNQGGIVTAARDAAIAKGIIINGLPLMTEDGLGRQWHLKDLDRYYYHCVIGGPGAFVVPVLEWAHFSEAVRRKLTLELAWQPAPPTDHLRPMQVSNGGYDCLIGEKIWDSLIGDMQ